MLVSVPVSVLWLGLMTGPGLVLVLVLVLVLLGLALMTWLGQALLLRLRLVARPMLVSVPGLVPGLASQRRPRFSLRVSAKNFGVLTKFLFHIRFGSFRSR